MGGGSQTLRPSPMADTDPTQSQLPRDAASGSQSDPSPMRTMVARWRSTVEGRVCDTMATDVDRVVCVLMHLWPILFPALGPFCLLVPLVLWFPFRSRSPLIDDHGREALNAILTLALLVCVPCVGWLALVVWFPVWLVSLVRAAVAGGSAELFRYPMVLRPIT
jgi:uncharacterized Tic20 family protein